MRAAVIIVAMCFESAAFADSAGEEISAGTTLTARTLPATEWISDRISGAVDAGERWRFGFDLGVTRSYAPDPTVAPTDIVSLAASAGYDATDHWSVSLRGGFSPATTTYSTATVLMADGEEVDVDLAARSSMGSVSASATYDTAGDSDAETSISIGVGATRIASVQSVSTMASPMASAIDQLSIDANVTRTYDDLDLGVSATVFAYDEDPTKLGYFPLVAVGRDNLGRGAGIAPIRFAIAPSIAKRWSRISTSVDLAIGSYLDGGYDLTPSIKVAYKIRVDDDTRVKLYSRIASAWSVDAMNELYATASFALGAQYSW